MKIAVFVSGRGSNLKAILDSPDLKNIAEVKAVFSNKADCGAFKIADNYSIKTYCLGGGEEQIRYSDLAKKLKELEIDFIVLAGFLKLIPDEVIKNYKWKIINIHPALLPSFGGKGMYGINVHTAVFKSSAKISGATVHFVDETYDTGKIISQRCVDISDLNSPEEIAAKVLEIEHKLLPFVIYNIAKGRVKIIDDRVVIEK